MEIRILMKPPDYLAGNRYAVILLEIYRAAHVPNMYMIPCRFTPEKILTLKSKRTGSENRRHSS